MTELSTFIGYIIAGACGYIAGYIATRILRRLNSGEWR